MPNRSGEDKIDKHQCLKLKMNSHRLPNVNKTEKVVMKEVIVIVVTLAVLLAVSSVRAGVCEIKNGSFEDDGYMSDITVQEPNAWDANIPAAKFGGYVYTDAYTDGIYNLTLYSRWTTFAGGDMATVSQQVSLTDVHEIIFDLKLDTDWSKWDPNICTAVLLIDDDVVWESKSVGSDVRGQYLDQTYRVEDKYRTLGPHRLSLGIRMNLDQMVLQSYITQWDSLECTLHCGGGGLLTGDFNRDCYVDMSDLKLVADAWLDDVDPYYRCNLYRGDDLAGYGTISFGDFAIYAVGWHGNMEAFDEFAEKWLDEVDLDDQHNLFGAGDVEASGIVNFLDLTILADNWLGSSLVQEVISEP